MKISSRRDILLLLLYSPGKDEQPNRAISGRTRLVKMLFLFKEEALDHFRRGTEITEENFYNFFPWNFGPFSSQVYDDLKFFELRGFIHRQSSDQETVPESAAEWQMWLSASGADMLNGNYSEYEEEEFCLTTKGARFVEKNLIPDLASSQKKLLREFRQRTESVPLRGLLRYVYEQYPSQTEKSQIFDQIIG